MKCNNVTRNMIRAIPIGMVGEFTLPSIKALKAARVQFSMMKKLDGLDFIREKTDEPLTIAYRRVK